MAMAAGIDLRIEIFTVMMHSEAKSWRSHWQADWHCAAFGRPRLYKYHQCPSGMESPAGKRQSMLHSFAEQWKGFIGTARYLLL